jgi:hypothetical protein
VIHKKIRIVIFFLYHFTDGFVDQVTNYIVLFRFLIIQAADYEYCMYCMWASFVLLTISICNFCFLDYIWFHIDFSIFLFLITITVIIFSCFRNDRMHFSIECGSKKLQPCGTKHNSFPGGSHLECMRKKKQQPRRITRLQSALRRGTRPSRRLHYG